MSLADAIDKSGDLLETLMPATLTTVFKKPPQVGPSEAELPAALQRPTIGEVTYSVSQRDVRHTIEVVVFVARTNDQQADYDAVMPLLEPLLALYEAHTTLVTSGSSRYYGTRVTGYEIGPATYGDDTYLTLILSLFVKEKTAVSIT